MQEKIVIIGAGQAGVQALATLRAEGFSGAIAIVGEEDFPPYQRPPLSKAYLLGQFERERLFLRSDSFYCESHCDLMLHVRATAIDRAAKKVTLADGRALDYDKLLLTTGTRARRIACPGAGLPGVHYLRSIADVDLLQKEFTVGRRIAIIGGGYIGLEVAAVAAKRRLHVTVFEALDRLMARAVSKPVSDFYETVHRAAGVEILLNTGVELFEGEGKLERVRAGGKLYDANIAVVGIGALPHDELARAAGLECDDGIIVDIEHCATSDPAIYAAGDCTRHIGRDGALIRLECVQNAIDQAKHAALAMVGRPMPYREVPWFWSDQYDLKLQIAGLVRPGDRVVLRGGPPKFSAFHLRDGMVVAVEAVNAAPDYLIGKRLIAAGAKVAAERLADLSVPMKQMV